MSLLLTLLVIVIFRDTTAFVIQCSQHFQRSASRSTSSKRQNFADEIGRIVPLPLRDLPVQGGFLMAYRTTLSKERHNFRVECLSGSPPIYLFRGVLQASECQALVDAARFSNQAPAETVSGNEQEKIRLNSAVSWLPNSAANGLVGELGYGLASMVLPRETLLGFEDMQVVQYGKGGEYSLHHDGLQRAATVLYYLNGNGGTWFPFADIGDDGKGKKQSKPTTREEAIDWSKNLIPGEDGLVVSSLGSVSSLNVATVQQGDAIVFYNLADWSCMHTGMPVQENEKVDSKSLVSC